MKPLNWSILENDLAGTDQCHPSGLLMCLKALLVCMLASDLKQYKVFGTF